MPAIKGQAQKQHTTVKAVTLWPCLHVVEFIIAPRQGDFVLCRLCDDYREVQPVKGLLAAVSPEEMEAPEGTVSRGRKPRAKPETEPKWWETADEISLIPGD